MTEQAATALTPPEDGYEAYYAEKLWEWIPELYKTLDFEAPNPGVLRAMIEIVAVQAATLRRDVDRIWDDQSIELADDWAVAYLGELVGATPVSGFNARGSRLSVAKAVRYQRRKGTLTVLQELIRDIGGVEGVVVEAFRRLVRFPHRLDINALGYGTVTGTPAGGFLNLRNPRVAGLTDSAFDEAAHFADVRRLRGLYGRYGIRKANFHLYPLRSYPLSLSTPVQIAAGRWTLDPSGREVPLFQRGQTSDRPPDAIRETDLPDEIPCRRFNAARHRITPEALGVINDTAIDTALAPLLGVTYPSAPSFRSAIAARLTAGQLAMFAAVLLDATRLPDSPRAILWGDPIALVVDTESSDPPLPASAVMAAELSQWGAATPLADEVALAFDPATGRMVEGPGMPVGEIFTETLHYGLFDDIGAGTYARSAGLSDSPDSSFPAGATGGGGGFTDHGPQAITLPATGTHRFTTSKTYEPAIPAGGRYDNIEALRLEAEDGTRPHIRFHPDAASLEITFEAAAATGDPRELIIDGLWLGLIAATLVPEAVADGDTPASLIEARIILDGSFDRVAFRHATIDPGGERTRSDPTQAVAIPYVRLEVEGLIEVLEITRCITGPIAETNATADLCNVGRLELCDSIVQSLEPTLPAISTRLGEVHMTRTTVLGDVEVARLYASDSLIDGRVRVTDNQHGCFRYSATGDYSHLPAGQEAALPTRFESFLFEEAVPPHILLSRRFGDPHYGALSPTSPQALRTGGSNGAEMGAFHRRGLAVLLGDLEAKVREFLPVGVQPQYVIEL